MKDEQGLTGLNTAELKALRERIASGSLGMPPTAAGLQAAGLAGKPEIVSCLAGLDSAGAVVALDLLITERTHAPRPALDLVWTGPEAAASTARDTWVVMRELFGRATRRVLIAGFEFDSGEELFAPLHRNMVERDVRVQVFFNVPRATPGTDPADHARATVQRLIVRNWPWQDRFPEFYYDPRTADPGSLASLHAKCVVVDERFTLIGSANFTDRGRTRNIEVGVLIDDPDFARQLVRQWQGLVNEGLVERVVG